MIKQTIKYNSTNEYFAGFLQNIINESEINGSVEQNDRTITLLLDDSKNDKVEKFNELVSKYLPHSIFLSDIETSQVDTEINQSSLSVKSYNISPCTKCIEMLNDPADKHYLDETLKCDHYGNSKPEEFIDHTIFSPHYSEGSAVLVSDAAKVNDLFILTEDEIKALFSIEKPTIQVTIKEEALKEATGKKFIDIKSPYNTKSLLVAINAKESGIPYLFFNSDDDLKVAIVQNNTTIIKASRVARTLEDLNDDIVLNRFLNIAKEAGFENGAIAANLSNKNGISFLVSNEVGVKKAISFKPFVLKDIMESFEADETRSRLINNLKNKFPTISQKLEEDENRGLFETISIILELDAQGYQNVSEKSLEFRGNGGLKIDTHYDENGFDYGAFLGSIISFKLAGVDTHFLAYSIFEAIADLTIATLNQLKTKFKIENFIMMGDMFENRVLYSRILTKFQLSNPFFSKMYALDD